MRAFFALLLQNIPAVFNQRQRLLNKRCGKFGKARRKLARRFAVAYFQFFAKKDIARVQREHRLHYAHAAFRFAV